MVLQRNVELGAIATPTGLVIGGKVERCLNCNSVMCDDGCSNPACWCFRGEPILQTVIRKCHCRKH